MAIPPENIGVTFAFVLSQNNIIETSDCLLLGGRNNSGDSIFGGNLEVGESVTVAKNVFVPFLPLSIFSCPGSIPTGDVFIGFMADEFEHLDELDETDNTAFQPIEIKAFGEQCPPPPLPMPDLVVSSLTHDPPNPTPDSNIELTAIAAFSSSGSTMLATSDWRNG